MEIEKFGVLQWKELKKTYDMVNDDDLLCQLAEESGELGFAAMNRFFDIHSPRKERKGELLRKDIMEEFADVNLMMRMAFARFFTVIEKFGCELTADSMNFSDDLSEDEILQILQHQCYCLSKGAMKLRRAKGVTNPTKTTEEEAKKMILGSWSFILNCRKSLFYRDTKAWDFMQRTEAKKIERWHSRLQGSDVNEQE